ncbi:MAG: thiamine diphosphokinase [Prevotellaceae bacterium]|jgi:thiamine pyrophosphokinase|nr:thiamine diphosphokinase [Prevotellaceae bacterium]
MQTTLPPPVVILADGAFPAHSVPLRRLSEAGTVVCCDGAAVKLLAADRLPDHIVGDLDTLPDALSRRFSDRLHHDPSQATNDLTKAVNFCLLRHVEALTIVGASGLREDHTLANISLLADYAAQCRVEMITDYGTFVALRAPATLDSFAGQQVSVFSLTPAATVSSAGLRYPLCNRRLTSWWTGSLNEALGASFSLRFHSGLFIVFRQHRTL